MTDGSRGGSQGGVGVGSGCPLTGSLWEVALGFPPRPVPGWSRVGGRGCSPYPLPTPLELPLFLVFPSWARSSLGCLVTLFLSLEPVGLKFLRTGAQPFP